MFLITLIAVVHLSCPIQAEAASYPRSIVVFDGFWLGSTADGKWMIAEDFSKEMAVPENPFPYPFGGDSYAIYDSSGYVSSAGGEGLHRDHPGEFGDELDKIDMRAGGERGEEWFKTTAYLGLSGIEHGEEEKIIPRKAVALPVKNAAYEKIMKEYLAKNGLPDATVNIMQLFKVDLEGDGVDEVVLYAQNVVDPKTTDFWQRDNAPMEEIRPKIKPFTEPGMYSVLLLRKIVSGKVREIPITSFIVPKDTVQGEGPIPAVQRVYSFADLNGDGTLEMIYGGAFYEGYGYNVIEVRSDGSFETVLSNGGSVGAT